MSQTDVVKQKIDWMDLLLIRIASYNQIIDPWVYILLRKEVLWKLISGVKFVLGIRKKEGDILVYQIQQKQNVEDSEENCCMFCIGCLCDPPVQRRRAGSIFSESVYDRRSTLVNNSTPMSMRRANSNLVIHKMWPPSPMVVRSTSYSSPLHTNGRIDHESFSSKKELHLLLPNHTEDPALSSSLWSKCAHFHLKLLH